MIDSLPDVDFPKFFGLPLNIDRSSQIVISNQVISQLKVLKRSNVKIGSKFDKETIKPQFKPLWKLWEALKKVCLLTTSVYEYLYWLFKISRFYVVYLRICQQTN